MSKFKKHFQKNLSELNLKEQNKVEKPKFTVCFMELASYMGIDLVPLTQASIMIEDTTSIFDNGQENIIKEEEVESDNNQGNSLNIKVKTSTRCNS